MNFLPKKSTMVLLTVYVSLWLLISIVGGNILNSYESVINAALGLTGYRIETITTEGEDLEYFKSKYVKKLPPNIEAIVVTCFVTQPSTFRLPQAFVNIYAILVTLLVFQPDKSRLIIPAHL